MKKIDPVLLASMFLGQSIYTSSEPPKLRLSRTEPEPRHRKFQAVRTAADEAKLTAAQAKRDRKKAKRAKAALALNGTDNANKDSV